MAWFIIDNHIDKIGELTENGIPVIRQTITAPVAIEGIAFPEEFFGAVRDITGFSETFTQLDTNLQDVYFIQEINENTEVVLERDPGMEAWNDIKPVLEKYAKKLGVKIFAKNPHGSFSDPITEEGNLYIRFYSSASAGNDDVYDLHTVFGKVLHAGGQGDALPASKLGVVIQDDDGYNVAEIVGGTLYILFDLPHGANAAFLMEEIMKRYAILQMSPEELQKHKEKLLKAEEAKEKRELALSRTNYVKECGRRIQKKKEDAKNQIVYVENQLENASKLIVDYTRQLGDLQFQLIVAEQAEKDMEAKFIDEYEKLTQLPMVKKVKVTKGCVSIFTKTVYLEYQKQWWELGDYEIDLYANGKLHIENLRIRELTNQTYFHHPHVFGGRDGNVCLGNIRDGVMRLIGQYEYSVAAQIIIEFLHTMTEPDKGTGRHHQYAQSLRETWKPMKSLPPHLIKPIKGPPELFNALAEAIEFAANTEDFRDIIGVVEPFGKKDEFKSLKTEVEEIQGTFEMKQKLEAALKKAARPKRVQKKKIKRDPIQLHVVGKKDPVNLELFGVEEKEEVA